jgi:hypothetical protein
MKMNTMMKTQIVTLLSGLCMIASIQAQTEPSKNQTAAASTELATFNIDFPGGTPGELIQTIAKESGTKPNVIVPKNVADVQLPKFKLRNVNAGQVFEALNMVVDETGSQYLRWMSPGDRKDPNQVWTLLKATPKPSVETCQVVFIGQLLDTFRLDDINAAIRTAWEMLGKTSTASLKFHKETQLLIVKGNGEELKLVFDVLKSLEQGAVSKKQAGPAK